MQSDSLSIRLLCHPVHCLALGFGTGLSRYAPGTVGTLLGLLLYLPLQTHTWLFLVAVFGGFIAGIWICAYTANALGLHDHPAIVYDEIIGCWITLMLVPSGWPWLLAGFIAFRLFDIVKPWPICIADQKIGGGFGIMFDDLLAALYAGLLLQLGSCLSNYITIGTS